MLKPTGARNSPTILINYAIKVFKISNSVLVEDKLVFKSGFICDYATGNENIKGYIYIVHVMGA
jgi:hypothetical protein